MRLFLLTLLTSLFTATLAFGATIQFTADNTLNNLTLNGQNISLSEISGNTSNWGEVNSYDFTYDPAQTYVFTWTLSNYGGLSASPTGSNPMAFIGQVDLDGSGWDLFSSLGQNSPWAILGSTNSYESEFGTNNAWDRVGWLPDGAFDGANWLGVIGDNSMQVSLTLAPTPTPIPGAAWLLGSGLVGLIGIRRKFTA